MKVTSLVARGNHVKGYAGVAEITCGHLHRTTGEARRCVADAVMAAAPIRPDTSMHGRQP